MTQLLTRLLCKLGRHKRPPVGALLDKTRDAGYRCEDCEAWIGKVKLRR